MNNEAFLKVQEVQLQELLDSTSDDFVALQLQQRLQEVREKQSSGPPCEKLPLSEQPPPRVALFLKGGGVEGSDGIRPGLAGEVVVQYEKMFIEQALIDEREAANRFGRARRPTAWQKPALLLTGTPRGSFGLEMAPVRSEDDTLTQIHLRSLERLEETLFSVCDSDRSMAEVLDTSPQKIWKPMKLFFGVLKKYQAELRLASSLRKSGTLGRDQIENATERLSRVSDDEVIEMPGILRGFMLDSRWFDIARDDATVVSGEVNGELNEDDLIRIGMLLLQRCLFKLLKTTLQQPGSPDKTRYTLLDAIPEPND